MNELQKLCSFLAEQSQRADGVTRRTNSVLKAQNWDIDRAIAQSKREVELLKAGYKPSQILAMMKEA